MFRVLFFFIFIKILFLNTLAFGQGISVSPMRVFFVGLPGETISHNILLTNSSQDDMEFVATFKDWDRDSLGNKRYYDQGALPSTNASWLSMQETSVFLKSGESKEISLFMKVSEHSSMTKLTNSMLFLTQVKEQTPQNLVSGLAINLLLEVGIQVYHIPEGLNKGNIDILEFLDRGMVVNGLSSNKIVSIKVKNSGEINKDAYLRFELTNMETGDEIPIEQIAFAMLPDAEQWINIQLPSNLTGRYLAVAIIDAGNQYDLKVAEKEIQY